MQPFDVHTAVTPESGLMARLQNLVSAHQSLEALLVWCAAQEPPVRIAEMIAQDEFTSDIIVP